MSVYSSSCLSAYSGVVWSSDGYSEQIDVGFVTIIEDAAGVLPDVTPDNPCSCYSSGVWA